MTKAPDWDLIKEYLSKLPEKPEPFDWKEYVGDAYVAGYDAAMKEGMQHLLERIDSIYRASFYETDKQ